MGNLLTTITMTAVAPFIFNGTPVTPPFMKDKVSVVKQVEKPKESTKKVEKKEAPKETPKVETPKVVTYTVQEGDNLTVIADKFSIDWTRIWQKNEQLQNQDQLSVGDTLTIPDNSETLPERALGGYVSPSSVKDEQSTVSAPVSSYRGSGGVNGYAVGWCTWWVKEKRPDIGGYWGNAGYNWISQAQASGFSTGSEPRAGAIGVTSGHVVYVESVSGSTVNISEMGWNYQANTTPNYRSVSASSFTYIY